MAAHGCLRDLQQINIIFPEEQPGLLFELQSHGERIFIMASFSVVYLYMSNCFKCRKLGKLQEKGDVVALFNATFHKHEIIWNMALNKWTW